MFQPLGPSAKGFFAFFGWSAIGLWNQYDRVLVHPTCATLTLVSSGDGWYFQSSGRPPPPQLSD
ncbi:hypothetical protein ACN4EG_15170 [Alkalinema pantanalense CENA528]|uniref:hypothetical protein n=1 Tax=Alkalinema pantanalense TaxID=1620705 RepID=UPI003D6E164B